jgi:hypothetical protein
MTKGYVLDPTALRTDDIALPGPDAGPLAGGTVGFRVDEMWRAWGWISEIWAEEFRKAGPKLSSGALQGARAAKATGWPSR